MSYVDDRIDPKDRTDEAREEMTAALLERYDWLMRTLEPDFTAGEWLLIECALNERPPIAACTPNRLAYLAAEIADHDLDCALMRGTDLLRGQREVSRPEDVDSHHGVDRAGLVARLRAMSLGESVAVVDALERRLAALTIDQRVESTTQRGDRE